MICPDFENYIFLQFFYGCKSNGCKSGCKKLCFWENILTKLINDQFKVVIFSEMFTLIATKWQSLRRIWTVLLDLKRPDNAILRCRPVKSHSNDILLQFCKRSDKRLSAFYFCGNLCVRVIPPFCLSLSLSSSRCVRAEGSENEK